MTLEDRWENIKSKVILPLWFGKFQSLYTNSKLDFDDFQSLAGLELTKALENFDEEKSNIYTYCCNVLTKKAISEIKATQRNKRKALFSAESLDAPVGGDTEKTVGDNIPAPETEKETEISELSEMRCGKFVNALDNKQLRTLVLSLLGFKTEEIAKMLGLSKNSAQSIFQSLKSDELTRLLYRRKF